MTQALHHQWMTGREHIVSKDLYPNVRQGFDARKTLKRAITKIAAINTFVKSKSNASSLHSLPGASLQSLPGTSINRDHLSVNLGSEAIRSPLPTSEISIFDESGEFTLNVPPSLDLLPVNEALPVLEVLSVLEGLLVPSVRLPENEL